VGTVTINVGRLPALRELYSKPRQSNAWEFEQADAIRFWIDD
jgi:hypothetical protein